ncbi:Hsp33 family molecular chaperone HslO, partial [Sphingomonas yabuuchiae]|nr:Hsp33 family molecular chaperone HslO [Sphingomonas yabuuchiae]
VRVSESPAIVRGCRCSAEYLASVIRMFSVVEGRELADAVGLILVDGAFCAKNFPVPFDAAPGA